MKTNVLKSTLLATSVLAVTASNSASAHFWAGLNGGIGHGHNSVGSANTVTDGTRNANLSTLGAIGGISFGWGMPFSNDAFFAGLQVGADLSNISGQTRESIDRFANGLQVEQKTELKRKHSFDAALKLGTYIDNVLAYIKLGVGFAQYELKSTFASLNPAVPITNGSKTFKKYFVSFRPAVGFDVPVSDCLNVGLVYEHEFTKSKSFNQNINSNGAIQTANLSVKPSTGTVRVTVNYKFGQGVA